MAQERVSRRGMLCGAAGLALAGLGGAVARASDALRLSPTERGGVRRAIDELGISDGDALAEPP